MAAPADAVVAADGADVDSTDSSSEDEVFHDMEVAHDAPSTPPRCVSAESAALRTPPAYKPLRHIHTAPLRRIRRPDSPAPTSADIASAVRARECVQCKGLHLLKLQQWREQEEEFVQVAREHRAVESKLSETTETLRVRVKFLETQLEEAESTISALKQEEEKPTRNIPAEVDGLVGQLKQYEQQQQEQQKEQQLKEQQQEHQRTIYSLRTHHEDSLKKLVRVYPSEYENFNAYRQLIIIFGCDCLDGSDFFSKRGA
jgi:hypothetical protein